MRQNTTANRFKSKVAVAQGDDEQGSVESLANLSPKTIWQSVRREHLAFWAICGWLFFEYVKPQAIYGWLDFMPWSQTLMLGALVLSFAKGDKAPNVNGLSGIHAGLVAFFIVILLSSVFAYNSSYSFSKATVMGQWFIVYYLVLKIINTEKRFFIFFLLYLLCNFKMSQHGFVSWVSRGFSFADFGVSGSPGWFMNSGEFAMQMCVFLPLSIAFIQAFKHRWSKWLFYFMLLFPVSAFSSILASSSRGAILGLIAIGLAILFQRKKIFKRLAVVVVAFGIAFAFTPDEFKERFTTAGEDDTSTLRLHYWGIATDIGNSNPLLGIGYYNWIPYFKAYHFDPSIKYKPEEVHSTYFQALAELGYSGLVLLFLFAFSTWRLNRFSVKMTSQFLDDEMVRFYHLSAKALNYGLFSLMVTSTFISALYYPFFWIQALFSALVGVIATVRCNQVSSSRTVAGTAKYAPTGPVLPVKTLTSRQFPVRR